MIINRHMKGKHLKLDGSIRLCFVPCLVLSRACPELVPSILRDREIIEKRVFSPHSCACPAVFQEKRISVFIRGLIDTVRGRVHTSCNTNDALSVLSWVCFRHRKRTCFGRVSGRSIVAVGFNPRKTIKTRSEATLVTTRIGFIRSLRDAGLNSINDSVG